MRAVCNLGYGRHGCEQFPPGSETDAIRFHVAKDGGELINIQYVFEKDCWPAQRGDFDDNTSDEILRRQAHAFLESYRRRRAEA